MVDNEDFRTCVVDAANCVIEQGGPGVSGCQGKVGAGCRAPPNGKCKLAALRDEALTRGVHVFRAKEVDGEFLDVVLIRGREHCHISAFPLAEKAHQILDAAKSCHLTPRELEIMSLMAVGLPNGRLGERLGISANTLRAHQKNIYRKLPAKVRRLLEGRA